MQIDVSKIKDSIIKDSFCIKDMEIINSHNEKIKVNELTGNYQVYRIDSNDIHAKIDFLAKFTLPCSNCAEEFILDIEDRFSTIFTSKEDYLEGDVTLSATDLDMKFFNEDVLDLENEIINNILLTLPISPICGEKCKGLCPNCGVNLNTSKCSCSDEKSDPRWKVLETFINKE